MKIIITIVTFITFCFLHNLSFNKSVASSKPRLLVLTDIGGDPDDQQSMVRLMTYANEFEIEGLIASASGTPGELSKAVTQPHLIREIVHAYGKVYDNLRKHKPGYPTEQFLLDRIKSGQPLRGNSHIGAGNDTEGSSWIISVVDKPVDRPVNIVIWGGQTDLMQALWRVKHSRSHHKYQQFVSRIRVYDISDQDNIFDEFYLQFPGLFYLLNKAPEGEDKRNAAFRGMYLGGDESLTSREWIDTHVRNNHGPLGALYPSETWTAPNPHGALKEGDTPSWFFFLPTGLNDPEQPGYGGWGGRFLKTSQGYYRDTQDSVRTTHNARAAVWRWRPDFQNDFQARMDWCIKPYGTANHKPIAILKSETRQGVQCGQKVTMDASSSTDPDGDSLTYYWFVYPEAGTYRESLTIRNSTSASAEFIVPKVDNQATIHIILRVTDNGNPNLTGYQRLIFDVSGNND